MATNTARAALRKPAGADNVNVLTDISNNMDQIDEHLGYFVCTSSTRPTGSDRFTGRTIYETDTLQVLVWDGAAWQYIGGHFQSTWTPVISGTTSGTCVIGNGTMNANYMRIGHWVKYWIRFTHGSTTAFAPAVGSIQFSLPPIASTMGNVTVIGSGAISEASSGDRHVVAVLQESTTTMSFLITRTVSAIVTEAVPWNWQSGDTMRFSGEYKVTP